MLIQFPRHLEKDIKKDGLFSTRVYHVKTGKGSQLANTFRSAPPLRKTFRLSFLFNRDPSYFLLRSLGELSSLNTLTTVV